MIHGLLLGGLIGFSLMGFATIGILATTWFVLVLEPSDNNAVKKLQFGRKVLLAGIIICVLSFGLVVWMNVNPAIVNTLIKALICDGIFLLVGFSGLYAICLGIDTIHMSENITDGYPDLNRL